MTIDVTAADVGVWRRKADDAVVLASPSAREVPALAPSREALATGPDGTGRLIELLTVALAALDEGAVARGGPLPAGGPHVVAAAVRSALYDKGLGGGQDGWSQTAAEGATGTRTGTGTETTTAHDSVLPHTGI